MPRLDLPPPILDKSGPPADAETLFTGPSVQPGAFSGYLHMPFRKTLCSFCYYRVIPGREREEKSAHTDCLIREIAMRKNALQGQVSKSVYLEGGNPYLSERPRTRLNFQGVA
ncbi:hypothetical protein ACIRPT_06795 [Streptomyces sp. NPDC101227]|uniref:hypothetical protein n=1 Tax=Streptomyces sp. NPDC101227 TaxID=3366136 RepID=UPI00381F29D8